MNATLRAAILASVLVGAASLVVYFQAPQSLAVILYIAVMVPLWAVDNLGVIDVGRDENGFFLPTPAGYMVGAMIFWCVLLLLIRMVWPGTGGRSTR
jgi:hypothetical protein